jgi:class 3 adenylate cyclase
LVLIEGGMVRQPSGGYKIMPVYMDRHNVKGITPAQFAEAHEMDIAIQDEHGVRFLSVWFDEEQGLSFCLAQAPDEGAVQHIHQETHGNMPSDIVAVDLDQVKAFLGRTSDPEPAPGAPPMAGIDSALRIIMFTDLEDSTAASFRYGDRKAFELLRIHDELSHYAIEVNKGRVVKHTGDGTMSVFDTVEQALSAAVMLQKKLAVYNAENSDMPLHVRIGLNAGNPVEHGGDFFGITVQTASRVCDQAQPGQILISGIMRELCSSPEWEGHFNDAGRAQLKGIPNAMQLYEITWAPASR